MLFEDYCTRELQARVAALPSEAIDQIGRIARTLQQARHTSTRIFTCGNGGSAATADHFACDLTKNAGGFRAMSLAGQTAMLTALANDIGYTTVFAAQLEALADANDILVAISVSGNSLNVLSALRLARQWGMHTIGLLGLDGGEARRLCDQRVIVWSRRYDVVEDLHLTICHMLTAYFKEEQCGS